jgi:hypothetical protein
MVINARRGIAVDLEVSDSIVLTPHFGIAKVSTISGGFANVARHCRDCVGSLWSCQGRNSPMGVESLATSTGRKLVVIKLRKGTPIPQVPRP